VNDATLSDISQVTPTGTIKLDLQESIDLSARTDLGSVDTYTIATTKILTLTDDQVGSNTLEGTGEVLIKVDDNSLDTNLANVSGATTVTLELAQAINLTASSNLDKVDAYTLSGELTINDSDITGKTVTGAGEDLIIETDSSSVDLSQVDLSVNTTIQFTSNVANYTGDTSNIDTFVIDTGVTVGMEASNIGSQTITNNGTLQVTNLDARADMDLSGITGTVTADWSGTDTFTGTLGTTAVTISSGTMSVDSTKVDGKTVNGAGTLEITGGGTVDLANITTTTLIGDFDSTGTTINNLQVDLDASSSSQNLDVHVSNNTVDTIIGGSGSDTVYVEENMTLSSLTGVETITVTAGKTLNVDGDAISGKTVNQTGGTASTLNITKASSPVDLKFVTINDLNVDIDSGSATLSNIKESLDASGSDADLTLDIFNYGSSTNQNSVITGGNGDDTVSINADKFTVGDTLVGGSGSDTLHLMGTHAGLDGDFANVSGFENLTFDGVDNSITLGANVQSAGINSVDMGAGSDTVNVAFDNTLTIDGGADTDTVNINTTNSSAITTDTVLGSNSDFSNVEVLDFSSITLNVGADASDGGTNAEFTITKEMIQAWTDAGDDLTIKIQDSDKTKIEFTDDSGTKHGSDDTGTTHSEIIDNTYDFGDGVTLTVDVI
ncbi:MAG: hypothetical protein K0U47_00615, partial [Epsilonproteobacteria bacterium]|nr:hypothetical protein [Campylobacterota bacterium]